MIPLALVTIRSSIVSPRVGVCITWVKKLCSMHSRSLPDCLQLAVLLFQQMSRLLCNKTNLLYCKLSPKNLETKSKIGKRDSFHSQMHHTLCVGLKNEGDDKTSVMESQHHRKVEIGRGLWKSPGPTPLLKQGHLEPVAQDHVQVFTNIDKIPPEPSLLQAEQLQLSQPFLIAEILQFLHHLSGTLLDTLQDVPVSLVLGSPELDPELQMWPQKGRITSQPAVNGLSNAAQDTFSLFCHKGMLLAHVQFRVHQDQQVLSCKAAFQLGEHVLVSAAVPPQPVPMLDNPFSEVKFPNIQSKSPLVQLEAISSRPITCYLGEDTNPHLSTTSFQVVVESNKVSPQPPFLQAKQPQFPQPLLRRLLLQTLHQLRCPSLDTLQHLNVSLVVRGPKLNTVFQCQVQGHDHFPSPAGHDISDTSQDAIGLLGHLGTLLAHTQAAVNQHPQVLFHQAAFQPFFPKPVALHGIVVAQVQDLALGLVEPHTIDLGPSIQPVQ
ncbi:hypothetical protein QYF61_017990, partial [Mycteria americana]